jgi:hypothetical protein
MTEAEWLAGTDPFRMLRALSRKASARKRRLFAVACCRRIWQLFDESLRQTVREAERLADQPASREDWVACRKPAVEWAKQRRRERAGMGLGYYAVLEAASTDARIAAESTANQAAQAVSLARADETRAQRDAVWQEVMNTVRTAELREQAALLRDVFRPFGLPRVAPAWLEWNSGAVARLAQVVYEEGRWQDLPVLADALEEAGCNDSATLDHLRSAAIHVRGCWVVDALTGRA